MWRVNKKSSDVGENKKPRKLNFFSKLLESKTLRGIGLSAAGLFALGIAGSGCDVQQGSEGPRATIVVNAPDTLSKPQSVKIGLDVEGNVVLSEMDVKVMLSQGERVLGDTTVPATTFQVVFIPDSLDSGTMTIDATLLYDAEQMDYVTSIINVINGWVTQNASGGEGTIDTIGINEFENVVLEITGVSFNEININVSSVTDTALNVFEGSVPIGESVPVYGPDTEGKVWYFEPFSVDVDSTDSSLSVEYNVYSEGI